MLEKQIPADWYQVLFGWDEDKDNYVCEKIFWREEGHPAAKKHYVRSVPNDEAEDGILHVGDVMPKSRVLAQTTRWEKENSYVR